ncbi:MAG: hypothetical protein L0Y71_12325 [Gemmataceae bacterium]|nr:hypothetical protein [Gemmataceae bacterium]
MAQAPVSLPVVRGFGETSRRDGWRMAPLITATVLLSFVGYATWAAFQGNHYTYGPYLSPFYSPELWGASGHAWFGVFPHWWPGWLPYSPALLILPFPGLFRLTCYYYRGAYYKAVWSDPPNCAVGEWRKSYWGENSLPLILQNIHRYFFYFAVIFIVILAWDAIKSYRFADGFGIGVGSLVLTINVILLGGYTFGCHSLRHLIGGRIDELTKSPLQHKMYDCVSCLNRGHMPWAWCSLVWVAFSDIYVRLCSMGIWGDLRIL